MLSSILRVAMDVGELANYLLFDLSQLDGLHVLELHQNNNHTKYQKDSGNVSRINKLTPVLDHPKNFSM